MKRNRYFRYRLEMYLNSRPIKINSEIKLLVKKSSIKKNDIRFKNNISKLEQENELFLELLMYVYLIICHILLYFFQNTNKTF